MSSTYFRKIEVVKTSFHPYANLTITDDVFAVYFETAESNVRDYNGGLCWNKYVWKIGTYSELMRDICSMSYSFEDGGCKWKPANKTPEGFIHTCRKAIQDAVVQDKLNSEERFISTFDKDENELLKKLAELEGVEYQTYFDNGGVLLSKNIVLMYYIRKFVEYCRDEKGVTPIEFAKQYFNKKGYISMNCTPLINLFKEEVA